MEAQKDPLLEKKLAVRRWDDQAKVPDAKVPPLAAYEDMAVHSLLDSWRE
jgi:predicted HD phosphohydrolase